MPAKVPVKFSSNRNAYILNVPKHEEIIDKGTHYETADGAVVYWGSEPHNNEGVVRSHVKHWKIRKELLEKRKTNK